MGRIKEMLKDRGYNLKERSYIYAGSIGGFLSPIVGFKYAITGGIETDAFTEALAWGTSITLNLIPFGTLPFSVWTGLAGAAVGSAFAEESRKKRFKKEYSPNNGSSKEGNSNLEKILD